MTASPSVQTVSVFCPFELYWAKIQTVRRVRGVLRGDFFHAARSRHVSFEGYEIHVGETLYQTGASPLADIERQGITEALPDGAVSQSGRVFGTYVHGFFDRDEFRHTFIQLRVPSPILPLQRVS
jgi:cobyric acid synthase